MRTPARAERPRRLRRAPVLAGGLWWAVCAVGASAPQSPTGGGKTVWDGVFSAEQASRGEGTYREWCASCHGASLEGADMSPPLTGGAFTSNWNQLTVGDLFERIRTTMPLDRPGAVRGQQNADLIAFILKSNGWPAGAAELPRELTPLKQIAIDTTAPK